MRRENNFDFTRLMFASFVIITHAYPISGIKECDWLCQLTGGQELLSTLGVKGFFIISGFLIFQSLERSKDLPDYFWKRFLRLFPALAVVLVLTVLFAPFVYDSSKLPYLLNRSVYTYVPKNLLLFKAQYNINGVFETNPLPSTINGSLWTIPYEFTMYVLLSFLFFCRKQTRLVQMILAFIFALLLAGNVLFHEQWGNFVFVLGSGSFLDLGVFFVAGSLLASVKINKSRLFGMLALASLLALVISVLYHQYDTVKFFTLPIVITWFALQSTPIINKVGAVIGDLSYGIYIYGFPVEQALVYYFKMNYLQLMFWGLAISIVLAYLSWHLVESRALRYKNVNLTSVFRNRRLAG